jgi:hypothetical protein
MSVVLEWDAGLLAVGVLPIGLKVGFVLLAKNMFRRNAFNIILQGRLIGIGIYDYETWSVKYKMLEWLFIF